MSIAKTGAVPDSYKYAAVAIDSFDGGLLHGRLYHDCLQDELSFVCITEMALMLEAVFDRLRYPMKSVDQRSFAGGRCGTLTQGKNCGGESIRTDCIIKADCIKTGWVPGNAMEADHRKTEVNRGGTEADRRKTEENRRKTEVRGALAEYRLHVMYRFNATWQGSIVDMRDGSTFHFSSFLELMEYLDSSLSHRGEGSRYGLGKRTCEVTVRNFDNSVMEGDVSHPAVAQRQYFSSEYELKENIEHMLLPLPQGEEEGRIISPRTAAVKAGGFGPLPFVVRVLFRHNSTWQGTICWRETRCQVSFRSFMEMLFIMREAVAESGGWNEELLAASGHIG